MKEINLFRIWCKEVNNEGSEEFFQTSFCFKDKNEATKYVEMLNKGAKKETYFWHPERICLVTTALEAVEQKETEDLFSKKDK